MHNDRYWLEMIIKKIEDNEKKAKLLKIFKFNV